MCTVLANKTTKKVSIYCSKELLLCFWHKCTTDIWSTRSKWISLNTNWSICCITGACGRTSWGLHFLNSLNFWPRAGKHLHQWCRESELYSSRAASDELRWSSWEESALRQISCLMTQKITLYNRLTFDYDHVDKRAPS